METNTVHAIYFSPAMSTKKVVRAVASGISEQVVNYDITQGWKKEPVFSKNDIAVIGVPSYSGRVPKLASQYLSELSANNIPAIIICVYGNRAYEDTLIELKNICSESGFSVIGAGAFIARHSIFPNVAEGRPDPTDIEAARNFGQECLKKTEGGILHLTGNFPYREINSVPLVPKGDWHCDKCGICIKGCPTGAIDIYNPKKTDKNKCISCARCIEFCPVGSRKFKGVLYRVAKSQFTKNYNSRKENELFFLQ